MKRLFSIAAVFSLLIWLLLLVAWIRDRSGNYDVSFLTFGRLTVISLGPDPNVMISGDLSEDELRWVRQRANRSGNFEFISWPGYPPSLERVSVPGLQIITWPKLGIGFADGPNNWRGVSQQVTGIFLGWFWLLSLPAILPLCWIGLTYRNHRRRVYRLRNHLCISCGYDLRASTEKCPECGTAIASLTPSPPGRGPG